MAFTGNQIGRSTSYGYIYMNTGDWTGVTFSRTTSYQELTSLGTNFTLVSPSPDFAMTTDGRLKYTGIPAKRFLVDFIVLTAASFVKLYKNGSAINDSEIFSTSHQGVHSFLVDLSTNDYLSLWLKGNGAASISIAQILLSATSTDRR